MAEVVAPEVPTEEQEADPVEAEVPASEDVSAPGGNAAADDAAPVEDGEPFAHETPASVVPPDAALKAAEVAARLAAHPGAAPMYPVSSGGEHAAADNDDESNKRKFDGDDDYNDPSKRAAYGQEGYPTNGSTLAPIAPPEHHPDLGPGDATETIQCPSNLVGKVIGKGGETIRDLQNRSGARIQIDHTGEEGKPRTITITGRAMAVAEAKKLVDGVIAQGQDPASAHSDAQFKESVNCPPGIVGRVIGRGGETIRALQSASGAHISIDQNFPEGMDRQVHIQGGKEAVERGVRMVSELIAGGPGSANDVIQKVISKHGGGITQVLSCPKAMVGRVIGKGGETIKALQNNTGARIQIDQTGEPMTVTITGQPDAVQRAEAAVTDIINGGSGYLPPQQGYQQSYQQSYPGYNYQQYPGYNYQQGYYGQQAYGGYQQGQQGYYGQQQGQQSYPGYYQQPGSSSQGGFDASQQSAQTAQAAPAASAAAPASSGSSSWQELYDPQGNKYYYNSTTGVSQWEKPAEMH